MHFRWANIQLLGDNETDAVRDQVQLSISKDVRSWHEGRPTSVKAYTDNEGRHIQSFKMSFLL